MSGLMRPVSPRRLLFGAQARGRAENQKPPPPLGQPRPSVGLREYYDRWGPPGADAAGVRATGKEAEQAGG